MYKTSLIWNANISNPHNGTCTLYKHVGKLHINPVSTYNQVLAEYKFFLFYTVKLKTKSLPELPISKLF